MDKLALLKKLNSDLKDNGYKSTLFENSRKKHTKNLIIKGDYIYFEHKNPAEVVIQVQDNMLYVSIKTTSPNIRTITLNLSTNAESLVNAISNNLCFSDEFLSFNPHKEEKNLKEIIADMTHIIEKINQDRLTGLFEMESLSSPIKLENTYKRKLGMDNDYFEWTIAYLYLRDLQSGVTKSVNFNRVCAYYGIDPNNVENNPKRSPSVMIKEFGGKSIEAVSEAVDIHVNSLRKWFENKPITFHALMIFAINN